MFHERKIISGRRDGEKRIFSIGFFRSSVCWVRLMIWHGAFGVEDKAIGCFSTQNQERPILPK